MFPPKDRLTICFAHAAYQLHERFLRRQLSIPSFEVRTRDIILMKINIGEGSERKCRSVVQAAPVSGIRCAVRRRIVAISQECPCGLEVF